MPIEWEDLPPDIQTLRNKPVREGACIDEQQVCNPDPRVTAQLTDEAPPDDVVKPWRIANGYKGDVFLSPGGPSGLIGGLLMKLDDPQFYSHMGIMVSDGTEIRHATSVSDRSMHDSFTTGKILGVVPAPTDGFAENAIRFQWPGTVTQTIEQSFLTWRDHPKDGNEPHKDFSFFDPVTNKRYHIDSFSYAPNMVPLQSGAWEEVWPVVVKPCPALETTEVRRALHRVADAAKRIRGHYRLFCYSRGDIASNQAMHGGPMLEAQQPDPGCRSLNAPLVGVTSTVPVVCSTFVWEAVQQANRIGKPLIVLDERPFARRRNDARCVESPLLARRPKPNDGRVAPGLDGLYRYREAERLRAGVWLHDEYVVPRVRDQIDKALPRIRRGNWNVTQLLVLVGMFPNSVIAGMLDLSMDVLTELIHVTTDMTPSPTLASRAESPNLKSLVSCNLASDLSLLQLLGGLRTSRSPRDRAQSLG